MSEAQERQDQTPRRQPRRRTSELRDAAAFPVVGIGASAGGLEACSRLLDALPADSRLSLILVQHLDPSHESMMVDLLAGHTWLTVRQATDGMPLEPGHLYVIPPGSYLSVGGGALHLSEPSAPHGARLPFDFLLRSLAEECGARAVCVILSGTGADGSLGLKSVKEHEGLVIAQDPKEAGYDGMPQSAIATGAVDLVLPVAAIPEAIASYSRRMALANAPAAGSRGRDTAPDWLPEVIDLLRMRTAHDFRLYKPGTLQRRIERRMAMASVETSSMARYLDLLRRDTAELDLLAKDLLINVTSFFRDRKVFDFLAETTIPELVREHAPDQPLRIWIAGCSTGEETYSLAMLFREQILAARPNLKLQLFASDIDPDAVAIAREGVYPAAIEADVSPERLARFFNKEDRGYRVLPELREAVVFTVQDVLTDPPFSRLDMISCRNLLIYLGPEAQAKVVSLFHFALLEGGVLLLGSSEAIPDADDRFEIVSRAARLYRHVGRSRPGDLALSMGPGERLRALAGAGQGPAPSRRAAYGELCRRLVLESYAPAAVLINDRHECLYSLGPTERYLRVPPGHPTHDLLAMVRQGLHTRLRSAIRQASQQNRRVTTAGGRTSQDSGAVSYRIDVQPVQSDGEKLLLVCFVDQPARGRKQELASAAGSDPRVAELEQELEATKAELKGAIRNLEESNEEQKAISEEALSVNEEFQSTNEELLTSKEELQSLNEELTALNSQLQETLEQQRTTSDDLQNVLFSTNVATLFLDRALRIRFFTPATRSLFNILPGDIGRPLADLRPLASDGALLADARAVLQDLTPVERELEKPDGVCYLCRILPYRTQENAIEGVVITFADITERKRAADALKAARQRAELATEAKSRFLAAASHDLRQPLQTLALLQGLLGRAVDGEKARQLVERLDETLSAMSGMLNALLDINQIEAGTVRPEISHFPIAEVLERLREECSYHAQAKGLTLRFVRCGLSVDSDPRLLEQMVRNLLSNALKYTRQGKILLGCRRRGDKLSVEVWDTGAGIPETELRAIFEEYHQLDNKAHDHSRGFGLGLSIVQLLGNLLGHRISVRSRPGKGSVFAIEIALRPRDAAPRIARQPLAAEDSVVEGAGRTGEILVVEDEREVRELLELVLVEEGHRVTPAVDGVAALELVESGATCPDLLIADYNLPGGMNGLEVAAALRERLRPQLPAVILTGDISTTTLRDIAARDCAQLNKPVKVRELTQVIQRLLPATRAAALAPQSAEAPGKPTVFVVDDDSRLRAELRSLLEGDGREVEDYESGESFLAGYRPAPDSCLLVDVQLPGMDGLELLQRLRRAGHQLPAIVLTGHGDVPTAVRAMQAGAADFVEKPVARDDLLASIARALERLRDETKLLAWQEEAAARVSDLTPRQRQILDLVLAGQPSKNIAGDLGISRRTVENHRAAIMKKMGAASLPELARLAIAAVGYGAVEPPRRRALPAPGVNADG